MIDLAINNLLFNERENNFETQNLREISFWWLRFHTVLPYNLW